MKAECHARLLILLTCLTVAGCTATGSGIGSGTGNRVSFPTLTTPGQSDPAVIIPATIYRPAGAGPFPAMVVLHHCAGIDADLVGWARHLADEGYVSIVPDSFSPRGTGRVCATGQVKVGERVGDAYAAAGLPTDPARRTGRPDRADRLFAWWRHHHRTGAAADPDRAGSAPPSPSMPDASRSADHQRAHAGLVWRKDDCGASSTMPRRRPDGSAIPSRTQHDRLCSMAASFDHTGTHEARGTARHTHHLQYDEAATQDADARAEAFLAPLVEELTVERD